jgi:hypothetical protein
MGMTHKACIDGYNVAECVGSALPVSGCQLAATVPMHAFEAKNRAETSRSVAVAAILRAIGIAVVLSLPCLPIEATAQENGTDLAIVADQVRSQGFACDKPVSVERIEAEASADETGYVLKCDGATYQVHLIPDQAARIMKVE